MAEGASICCTIQPLTLEELSLPPEYQLTEKGEPFLSMTLGLYQRELSSLGRS